MGQASFLGTVITAGTARWRQRLASMTMEELRVTGEAIVALPFFTPGTIAAAYHAALMEILAAELASRGVPVSRQSREEKESR